MKTLKLLLAFLVSLGIVPYSSFAQQTNTDSTRLPGTNFSLEGALDLFKKAGTPEEFEKLLNKEDNKVNNLDLNEDGTTDYIKVINHQEKEVQIFVLQAVISSTENQDIAVIELEKNGNESAMIQIVGDEDLYGEETIVEPSDEVLAEVSSLSHSDNDGDFSAAFYPAHGPNASPDFSGPAADNFDAVHSTGSLLVNVWAWPSVRFVYAPGYRVWISPWSWNARPAWWRPWRPLGRAAFHPFHYQYRHRYVAVSTRRVARASVIYRPARTTSVTVRTKNQVAVSHYRKTNTTKTVTVSRGYRQNKTTRVTTAVSGPNGRVRKTNTIVRKKR